jgi:hypothetical protein
VTTRLTIRLQAMGAAHAVPVLSGHQGGMPPAPSFTAHPAEVLVSLGYDVDVIASLRAERVVA